MPNRRDNCAIRHMCRGRPFPSTLVTAESVPFWERVYRGATFDHRIGEYIRHSNYAVVPRAMTIADWQELSRIFGMDMATCYSVYMGYSPFPEKYTRHYEIEPLELPG